MENYSGKNAAYNHSSIAKNLVNELAIALINFKAKEFEAEIVMRT